jgi:hypothetical protein
MKVNVPSRRSNEALVPWIEIVGDLLDVSRIITGKLKMNPRPFEPATVVYAAVEAVRPAAESEIVDLVLNLDHNGRVRSRPIRPLATSCLETCSQSDSLYTAPWEDRSQRRTV